MKKIIILLSCLWSVAQAQPGYTKVYTRLYYPNGIAAGDLIAPSGTTATKPAGVWPISGHLYYDSTGADSGLYVSHGTYWVKIGVGSYNTSIGSGYKVAVNGTNNVKSLLAGTNVSIDSTSSGVTINSIPQIDSIYGDFVNTTFSGSSLTGTGFVNANASSFTVSNGLYIRGGDGGLTSNYIKGTAYTTSANKTQEIIFRADTLPTNYTGGITFGGVSANNTYQFNLGVSVKRAGPTTWRLVLKLANASNVMTDVDSSSVITMTAMKKYKIVLSQSNVSVQARFALLDSTKSPYQDEVESAFINYHYNYNIAPSAGLVTVPNITSAWISAQGGAYKVEKFREVHYDLLNADVIIFGTSVSVRNYSDNIANHYPNKIFEGTNVKYTIYAGGGNKLVDMMAAWPEARRVALYNLSIGKRVKFIIEGFANDNQATITSGLRAFLDTLKLYGDPYIFQTGTGTNMDTAVVNSAKDKNVPYVNAYTQLNSLDFIDQVHPKDAGEVKYAEIFNGAFPEVAKRTGSISGSISTNGHWWNGEYERLGLGVPDPQYPLHIRKDNTDCQVLIAGENNQAVPSATFGYTLGVNGSACTVPYWASSTVLENATATNLVLSSYAGKIVWQTGFRTHVSMFDNNGFFGINTVPDSQLHVKGGLRFETGRQGAGKVLTSDANGGADWQTPSGGGGSQGLQDVITQDNVLTTNNSVNIGSNDLIVTDGGLDLLFLNGSTSGSGLGGEIITIQANNKIDLLADSINFNSSPVSGNSNHYNNQTGTTYTLLSSDNGKIVTISNGSAITLTVPASLPAGFNCTIIQKGAGQITFTASSTTINNRQSFTKTKGQYSMVTIVQYGTNLFITQGDME